MSKRHFLSLIVQFRQCRIFEIRLLSLATMEPKISLKQDPAYQKLQSFYNESAEKINIQQLFQQDPDRFNKFR